MNIVAIQKAAKASVVVGCAIVVLGLFYTMGVNLAALCTELLQPPGTPFRGCGWDFTPMIIPAIVGGALMVTGIWTFWTFKPGGTTPAPPAADVELQS